MKEDLSDEFPNNTLNNDFCNGKKCYDKKTAQTAKNLRFKESHIKLRIYQCPECNQWHLTSKL